MQILRVFSESAGSLDGLKEDLAEARTLLGARHKQLQQQWSRSVTLRHVISLLDQIDKVAQVLPSVLRNNFLLQNSSKIRMAFFGDLRIGQKLSSLIIPEDDQLISGRNLDTEDVHRLILGATYSSNRVVELV